MKYSGQSTERREPGLDTNNSTFDFVVTPHGDAGVLLRPAEAGAGAMKRPFMIVFVAIVLVAGCGEERPDDPDGGGTIVAAAMDTSGFFPGSALGVPFPVVGAEVSLQGRTNIFTAAGVTNEFGDASFDGLATGDYSVFVRRQVMVGPNKKVFTGFGDVKIRGVDTAHKEILVNVVSVSNLMISEIHFAGSCASSFYFYDQYVELYNAAAETLYLDNIIVTRQAQTEDPEMEQKDYVSANYAFQLKGTGRQYPIAPGQYVVIAADAVNHKQWCANAVDLSHADYETFNALGNDYDVLGVPNFESIMPGKTTDFLINLTHNAVVIATGGVYPIDEKNYMRIPIDKRHRRRRVQFGSLGHQNDDGARRCGIRRNRHHAIQRPVDRAAGRGARYEQLDVRFRQSPPPDAGVLLRPAEAGAVCDETLARNRLPRVRGGARALMRAREARCRRRARHARSSGRGYERRPLGRLGRRGEREVEIAGATFAYKAMFTTDETGRVVIEGLPSGDYYIQASMRDDEHDVLLTGQQKMKLRSEAESEGHALHVLRADVAHRHQRALLRRMQRLFVLFLRSVHRALQLDRGHPLPRRHRRVPEPAERGVDPDQLETVDFALAYYMYQFPGTRGVTRECPIGPHEFVVIACDAINHHSYGGGLCVDLLNADYEFFNARANDYDNVSVPNLEPVTMATVDFALNLAHTGVFIATGEEYAFAEYATSSGVSQFVQVPLRTILDAVEYTATQSSTFRRYLTLRIDAGLGGNGMTRYSGQSIERKVPGFDSNNSSFDFEIVRGSDSGIQPLTRMKRESMERCCTVKTCGLVAAVSAVLLAAWAPPAKCDEIRTSAMGNCSIALEDPDNQINPYDYGRNPAYLGFDFERAWIRYAFSISEQQGDLRRPYDPHLLNTTFARIHGAQASERPAGGGGLFPLRAALAARAVAFARDRPVQRSVLPHRSHDGGHHALGPR